MAGEYAEIMKMSGNENPYALHREMAEEMISNVLIVRENSKLQATLKKLTNLKSVGRT